MKSTNCANKPSSNCHSKAALKTVGNEAATVNEVTKFEVSKTYAAKKSVLFDSQINITVIKRTNCYVTFQFDDDKDDIRRCKIVDEYGVEKIYLHESNAIGGDYEFSAQDEVTEPDADGHIDGYDENAFDLLPTVDELNDTRSDIEKEFDEFAAKYTDRDARFNHGERHAAKLEKRLREIDPTIEVTYDINEDGEDVFYLRFGKHVYRSPFATLDAVEETFHLWREADEAATSEQVTADMLSKRDEIIKQRNNLDVIKRNGIITEAEYADKAAELDSELRYVEVQIDAVKAGDTFDYIDAAEHIKSVYEDLQLCVDLWTRIHGLTVEQCEKVYVAAHVDRNFTDEADRELASRMIDHFKQGNELTAKLREVTSEADYKDVTCQDGATILAHFKGAKVTVDGGGYDILTAWDRLLGRYDTAAQVTAVINRIKVCVDDGKIGSFAFPTVDELEDKPAYEDKRWAVDFDICHADSDLTDAELEGCTDKLRKAMTANGNRACVEPEDCVIATFGDGGIDNDTVDNIVDEMTDSGCWVEYPEDDELTPEEPASEFDKAVTESVKNYSATIEINGETLTFEDGQLSEVGSTRYGAYFTIRNGRRIFYYRGNRVSKQDFFAHIETEDKAISERAAIAKFVAKYGGSEFKPGTNPQGNFVAQIHPTLANGRQDNYEVTFDTKDEAHAFIDEFKTLAGDMKFLATIKRGSFYGEVIYRHGLNGQEYFTTDTKESIREKKYALWDERRAIDGEIIGVKNAISEIKDGMRWLSDAGNCDAQIDELDYIIVKLEYRLGILSDKRNAIGAKIDDCNEKARIG